jgi:hypothetical protein
MMNPTSPDIQAHTLFEDAQAIFTGTLFVSLALILFTQAGLLTGGTAGVAFLLHYATGITLGKLFFLINLPFYWFAWTRMGREFTLKTFVAISMLSTMMEWSPRLFAIERLHPAYAAVLGGLLLGSGCLFLARHRASLGGAEHLRMARRKGADGDRLHHRPACTGRGGPGPGRLFRPGRGDDESFHLDQPQARPLRGDLICGDLT